MGFFPNWLFAISGFWENSRRKSSTKIWRSKGGVQARGGFPLYPPFDLQICVEDFRREFSQNQRAQGVATTAYWPLEGNGKVSGHFLKCFGNLPDMEVVVNRAQKGANMGVDGG